MTVELLEQDDLFAAPPRRQIIFPELCSIICAVCGLASKVPVTAPAKRCGPCMVSLEITRSGIEARLEALDKRAVAARDQWGAAEDAAPADVLVRWEKAADAGVAPDKAFAATWAGRHADTSPLARLLCAWETMQAECEAIERQRAAELKGLEEVEIAEQSA